MKSGIAEVYQNATYTITDAKQSKNTVGSTKSGLVGTQNKDAAFIVGPLKVADYVNLGVSYQWKAASVKGTYYTKLYYSIDGETYTEIVKTSGTGATTFSKCVYELPTEAQNSNLYLKTIFNTSNTGAVIDEFELTGIPAVLPTLSSIAVSGTPAKTTYFAGEQFDPTGLVVTGTYSDASIKEISEGIEWLVDPETLTIETTSVDVLATVKGADGADITSDLYPVNVTVTAPKELASLSVSGTPAEFWKGDAFNHDGMTVTATWSDETTTDVTDEATFSVPDMTTAGEKTVTVTYKEKTATYTIDVKTIANTQETAYTVEEAIALIDAGKDLDAEVFVKGVVSEITYAWNSQNNTITYNISDDGTTTAAQLQLYKCATNGANVYDRVIAKGVLYKYNSNYQLNAGNTLVSITTPVVSTIAISGEAKKTAYFAGQAFDPAGLVVTATYEDETTADVTALVEWVINPAVLEETTTSVSVSATYKEISATAVVVDVTVSEAPKIVTIDLTQDETTTASADKLEWKGTIVTVTADKANSSTSANNYYPGSGRTSTRFYTNSTLTFAPANGITIESIEYEATSEAYATAMTNSAWTNATAASEGMIVTITPTDGTKAVSATIGATTGGKSFVIYYSGEAVPSAIDNATVAEKAVKMIENGQLVIIREGVKYNAQGAVIR